jgi:hypothetical protein
VSCQLAPFVRLFCLTHGSTWLVEEKMINPETLNTAKTKEHFRTFVEDYNTGKIRSLQTLEKTTTNWAPQRAATLPHEKYYALENYERRMQSLRMGETLPESVFTTRVHPS